MNMIYILELWAHQRTAIQSVTEVLLWPSFDAVKEMAGSSHTPASCLSKLRSSLEAGKKQLRVWLQYACGKTEMLLDEPSGRAERLYPSYRVGFNPTFLTLGRANAFVLHSLKRKVPLVFLWSSHGDSEIVRSEFKDGSKWCATDNTCSSVNDAGFIDLSSCIQTSMNLCYGKGVVVT